MEGLKSEEGSSKRRKGNDEQSISDVSTHQDIAQHEQAASASAPAPAPESSAAANDTGTALLQKLVKAAQESGDHNTGVTPTQMIIQQAIAALPDTPSGDVVPMLGQQHHQADPSSEPPSGLPALPQPASMASFVQSSLHWVYNISTPETFDSNGQPLNRRKRRRTTDEEQAALEAAYRLDPQMPPAEREKLANTLNMPAKSVQIWFQNRRQTAKKNRDGTWDGLGKWQRTPYKVVGNYKVVGPEHVATPTPTKNNDPIDHAGVLNLSQVNHQRAMQTPGTTIAPSTTTQQIPAAVKVGHRLDETSEEMCIELPQRPSSK
ncbi:hypothetical protein DFS34DRAFT_98536 [Phlyctochytrium arcticum]|nr:hypothetical protein DFS34DRAFT_98536 [Phlyctochytrium arcticum]